MNNQASELIAALKRICAPYQTAIDLLRSYEFHMQEPNADRARLSADVCARMQPALRLIQECEGQLAPIRANFKKSDRCTESDAAVKRTEKLLRELLDRIDGLQGDLIAQRNSLGVSLDGVVQHSDAHRAYSAN